MSTGKQSITVAVRASKTGAARKRSPPGPRLRKPKTGARTSSSRSFKALVEAAPDWVWEADPEFRLTYASPQCMPLLGYAPEEMVGRLLLDFMPSATAAHWVKQASALRPISAAVEFLHKGGRTVIMETDATARFGPSGAYLGYRGYERDVTVRAREEEALRASEEKHRSLLLSTIAFTWECDRTGALRSISSQTGEVFGYPLDELVGTQIYDFTSPSERAPLESRVKAQLSAGTAFTGFEAAGRSKDGVEMTLEFSGLPMLDESGAFRGFLGTARNVSQRKRAEVELQYRDRILAAVTRSALELVKASAVDLAMPAALQLIGETLGVERIVVVEISAPAVPEHRPAMLYAWEAPGAPAHVGPALFADPAVQPPELAQWLAPLERGEQVVALASEASGAIAVLLDKIKSQSTLFVPILLEDRWSGAIGVDDCKTQRIWSVAETDSLKTFSALVGASIMRERRGAERLRTEKELERRARSDTLTGLANRRVFGERVWEAMEAARNGDDSGFAVLYLDLDHFKDVNDTSGHPTGDALLRILAERLRAVVRHTDLVARFGGDEFAILEMGVRELADAGILADKVLAAIDEPFLINDQAIHISGSIGIALYEPEIPDVEATLSHAELALYRAKSEGRHTYRFYTDAMDEETRSRVILRDELRDAMEKEQFFLVYQPQVEMESGRVVGVECLVRWRHPKRGIVGPTEFIAASERSGQIVQLGQWILKEACRQTRAWLDAGIAPSTVAVNISAIQFRRPTELLRTLAAARREAGIPLNMLQLELTETTLIEASRIHADVLRQLHDDGFRLSLDDFGTGYSSLAYLHRYPIDEIKIAQVFVSGIVGDAGDAAIVRAAISLARELGLQVVAEGAETFEQAHLLASWGCKRAQGYYFSSPLTAAEIEPVLRRGALTGLSAVDLTPPAAI